MDDAWFILSDFSGKIAEIDILDSNVLGVSKSEIKNVNYSPFFPGNPYLENDVAWSKTHPCMGSCSFYIEMKDGSKRIISPIIFEDENPLLNQFQGIKHWNIECWNYIEGQKPKRVLRIPGTNLHHLVKTD